MIEMTSQQILTYKVYRALNEYQEGLIYKITRMEKTIALTESFVDIVNKIKQETEE